MIVVGNATSGPYSPTGQFTIPTRPARLAGLRDRIFVGGANWCRVRQRSEGVRVRPNAG